jgi:hypothetical protein
MKIIEDEAGWWEWWFYNVQLTPCILNVNLFFAFLIILHLSGLLYWYFSPLKIETLKGVILTVFGIFSLIALLFISPKSLLGVVLIEILIAMLIIPIILLLPGIISMRSKRVFFSRTWQIWIACLAVLIFALFHKNIVTIKTPLGEIEMLQPVPLTREIRME